MDSADPTRATPEPADLAEIHEAPNRRRAGQPHAGALLAVNPEAERTNQQLAGTRIAVLPERHPVEATNGVLGRQFAAVPAG